MLFPPSFGKESKESGSSFANKETEERMISAKHLLPGDHALPCLSVILSFFLISHPILSDAF